MNKQKIKTGSCVVNHWQNRRCFAFTSKKVGLEVSAGFCDCSTCSSRYSNFLYTLQAKAIEIKYLFEYYEYSYDTIGCGRVTQRSRWVVLELPERKDAMEFLKDSLNISIDDIRFFGGGDRIPNSLKS